MNGENDFTNMVKSQKGKQKEVQEESLADSQSSSLQSQPLSDQLRWFFKQEDTKRKDSISVFQMKMILNNLFTGLLKYDFIYTSLR